jgi:diguanylate cyclase (GGDEF)-like protein
VDITERKEAQDRITRLAHYGTLTDLPNRALFLDRVNRELIRARRQRLQLALFFLDLDGFKIINDTFGHKMGDLLLREVARRLEKTVRKSDNVARMGGDEFTMLLAEVADMGAVVLLAEKVLATFDQSFMLDGNPHTVGASIGIAMFPADGQDANSLLSHADQAMYLVKNTDKNDYRFHKVP